MNTLHLKYVVEVAKTGSITQAADNLYMGQPNLSKAIRELEGAIGIDIFKRTSRGVSPTPKGEEFLRYARNILAQVEKIEALYHGTHHEKPILSLAAPQTGYVLHALTRFMIGEEVRDVAFYQAATDAVIRTVSEGDSNFGIIRCQAAYEAHFVRLLHEKSLTFETLWTFERRILLSVTHPLSRSISIGEAELTGCTCLAHEDGSTPAPTAGSGQVSASDWGSRISLLRHLPDSYLYDAPWPQALLEEHGLVQKNHTAAHAPAFRDILIYPSVYRLSKDDHAFLSVLSQVQEALASA